jgi:hypothetical protein
MIQNIKLFPWFNYMITWANLTFPQLIHECPYKGVSLTSKDIGRRDIGHHHTNVLRPGLTHRSTITFDVLDYSNSQWVSLSHLQRRSQRSFFIIQRHTQWTAKIVDRVLWRNWWKDWSFDGLLRMLLSSYNCFKFQNLKFKFSSFFLFSHIFINHLKYDQPLSLS